MGVLPRIILYYRGITRADAAELETLRNLPGVAVLDEVPGRLMLLEGDEAVIRDAVSGLSAWTMHPEDFHPLPAKW